MYDEDESPHTRIAVINAQLSYVIEKLNAVDEKVSKSYITKEEFNPVKSIVYGMVMLILIAVLGALIAIVVQGNRTTNAIKEQTKTTQQK